MSIYTEKESNSLAIDIQPFINNIYVGNLCGGLDQELLQKYQIKCIIHLIEDQNMFIDDPDQGSYLFPIEDDPREDLTDYFKMFDVILDIYQTDNILIHCQHGSSRTGAFVLYYLIKYRKMPYQKALEYAQDIRPGLRPNPGFTEQLKNLA